MPGFPVQVWIFMKNIFITDASNDTSIANACTPTLFEHLRACLKRKWTRLEIVFRRAFLPIYWVSLQRVSKRYDDNLSETLQRLQGWLSARGPFKIWYHIATIGINSRYKLTMHFRSSTSQENRKISENHFLKRVMTSIYFSNSFI
jgi:hypothetical protein